MADEGQYVCVAENMYGQSKGIVILALKGFLFSFIGSFSIKTRALFTDEICRKPCCSKRTGCWDRPLNFKLVFSSEILTQKWGDAECNAMKVSFILVCIWWWEVIWWDWDVTAYCLCGLFRGRSRTEGMVAAAHLGAVSAHSAHSLPRLHHQQTPGMLSFSLFTQSL